MAKRSNVLYIGIGGHVLALDSATGEEIWRRKLQSNTFQTILVRDGRVYAGVGGELSCLDGATGEILWTNKLKGLGMGLISSQDLATRGPLPGETRHRQAPFAGSFRERRGLTFRSARPAASSPTRSRCRTRRGSRASSCSTRP